MRPQVVIPVLLFSIAILLAVLMIHPGGYRSQTALFNPETSSPAIPSGETPIAAGENGRPAQQAMSQTDPAALDQETPDDYAARRIAELMDLAMSDDRASLYSILAELNNRDSRVREAAVTAAVQFKSPDAIPALQDAFTRADDPEEKTRIAKAIDFLAVPSESQASAQSN